MSIISITLSVLVLAGQNGREPASGPQEAPDTVIVECAGLRCAACQEGVLRRPKEIPGVRSVEFDPRRSWLVLSVDPGFDRHHELVLAIQHVAEPIEMFRATLLVPRQLFLYLDPPLGEGRAKELSRAIWALPGVKSVYPDDRSVLSIALREETERARILDCAKSLGYRAELFETRLGANREARISEASHHVIGVLILVMSFLILLENLGKGEGAGLGRLISSLWILGGILVILFSDLDSWPFARTLWDSFKDKMILQHKILGAGMVLLGVAELRRRSRKGWRYGPVTLFLAVALFSGVMLQFHFPDMVDPGHLDAWAWVNRQHLVAAWVGAAALVSRALSEYGLVKRPWFANVWPILLGVEGALLCVFFEPVW